MRFSTLASAAAFAPALVSATYSADLKDNLGTARVHNRCPYDVYLWSVKRDEGCGQGNMKVLKSGESYSEKYRDDHSGIGISIKISKEKKCKGLISANEQIDITQLEYHINRADPAYTYNFLDISFVDCQGRNCPGREAYYLKSGNNGDVRLATAGADGAVCPILKCSNMEECSDRTQAYIDWDDHKATKSCEPAADIDFYMCTDSPEGGDSYEPETPVIPTKPKTPKQKKPNQGHKYPKFGGPSKIHNVEAPAITPAPAPEQVKKPNIKTEVVYVTEYAYVNAKRHAHNHRHQHFRA